ncbi:hypothetical protein [Luteitalea sp. TBR-22]|uniref:hypothetical protein n=1 Tax=Luteitalea sp. TBR-22 TaxID=2802971 RepID=UPI001AFBD612|nr:hypothetical protein [Luteitalea sp. TBR-22]
MRPGSRSVFITALVILALGPVVLGLDWRGHETSPGVWRDGVALWRWGVLAGLLMIGGALMARALPSPGARLLVILPLLGWCGWMLRSSALGPLAWLIYSLPLLVTWLGGTMLGDAWRRWHAP